MASEAVAGTDYAETETGYEIHTPLGLAYITDKVNNGGDMMAGKQVALTADIDLTRENADGIAFTWLPIGSSSKNFKGAFDGRGHSVKNMLVNAGTVMVGCSATFPVIRLPMSLFPVNHR